VIYAVFLKKMGTHSDPNVGQKGGGTIAMPGKEKFWNAFLGCILLRKNFQNGVLACSFTKIPLGVIKNMKSLMMFVFQDQWCSVFNVNVYA
jgi:hypothetical protein